MAGRVPGRTEESGRCCPRSLRDSSTGLLKTTVLGEGPAKSPMGWGSRQKPQVSAFWRSRLGWGCWRGGSRAREQGETWGSQGWVLLRQRSWHRPQALHLCLNGIAKANTGSWSLLTGRFTEMKSLHQVTCSCSEELKLCLRSGWIKSLTSAGVQQVSSRQLCIFICILMLGS